MATIGTLGTNKSLLLIGGGAISQLNQELENQVNLLTQKINTAQTTANNAKTAAANAQTTANNALPKSNLTNSGSITGFGNYAVDGVHLNASVNGSLANLIAKANQAIATLNSKVTWDASGASSIKVIYYDTPASSYEEHLRLKCIKIRDMGEGCYLIPGGWQNVGYGASIGFVVGGKSTYLLNISETGNRPVAAYILRNGENYGTYKLIC